MPEPILFCWSGGKDSAMALHAIQQRHDLRVAALLTTVTEGYDRISMHGVRRELLVHQAASIGLPLHEVRIPPQCVNPIYKARMEEALRIHYQAGVRAVAFGDIFLEDLRAYREKNLARIGMTALFPIWKRDTRELIRHFLASGFRAMAVCVDPKVLDRTFAGRELDQQFFRDLPAVVDPCGENGEFHTFVFAGPIFHHPIPVTTGEVVERDSFLYCDLLPIPNAADSPAVGGHHDCGPAPRMNDALAVILRASDEDARRTSTSSHAPRSVQARSQSSVNPVPKGRPTIAQHLSAGYPNRLVPVAQALLPVPPQSQFDSPAATGIKRPKGAAQ